MALFVFVFVLVLVFVLVFVFALVGNITDFDALRIYWEVQVSGWAIEESRTVHRVF